MKHRDQIPGGKADQKSPRDFDRRQLAMGVKVEKEHVGDPAKAREIAMDHLVEDSKYYTKLRTIHKEAAVFSAFVDEVRSIFSEET